MRNDLTKYLKPQVIAGLKGIDLKARLIVEGFISGLHKSPYRGRSVEFADFRTYNSGDDLKSIDWKIYAKTDRYYVREYEERTNLKAFILIDISNSMSYGATISKYEYSCCLAASMSYILINQRDSVGICLFDNKVKHLLWPSSSGSQLKLILELLDKSEPESQTNISQSIAEIASKIKRRGMVIIFSDFIDDYRTTINSISMLKTTKNEVVAFQILDRDEKFFPFTKTARFHDLENDAELIIDPNLVRKVYLDNLNKVIQDYHNSLLAQGIDFISLTTDTAFDSALFTFLEKRKRIWSS